MLVHFLFSLHFHATLFSSGLLYGIISWGFAQFELVVLNQVIILVFGVFLMFYLFKALKVVYKESTFGTIWRFILLSIFYTVLISGSMLLLALLSS